MAETILSPGVYINENDQSFVTQGVVSTGAVIVGPTNKGPAFVPTVVRSTSEFQNRFGNSLQYNKTVTYVPQTVDAYLNQAGSVMVVRVLGGGGFSFGSSRKLAALVVSGSDEVLTVLYPSLNPVYPQGLSASLWDGNANDDTNAVSITGSYVLTLGGTEFPTTTLSASINTNSPNYILNVLGNQPNNVVGLASSSFAYINFRQRQSATDLTSSMIYLVTSSATIDFTSSVAEGYDHGRTPWITSGNSGKQLFKFHHRGDGFDTNTDVYVSITNLVEPADVNGVAQYSTFTVLVRKVGDDDVTPNILESYTGCNLNPHVCRYMESRLQKELQIYEKDKLRKYKRFDHLSKKAEDKGQLAVAVNAEFRSGQMADMFVSKSEIKHVGLEGMSREELEKRLGELEQKIGEAKDIIDVTPKEIVG